MKYAPLTFPLTAIARARPTLDTFLNYLLILSQNLHLVLLD